MRLQRGAAACAALFALFVLVAPLGASGHEMDSATLSLREVAPGRFLVHFRASSQSLMQDMASPALFPNGCRFEEPYLDCGPTGLVGELGFPWLAGSLTPLTVDIEWKDHTRFLRVITASAPSLVVYGDSTAGGLRSLKAVALDYTRLGVEHILTGFDHLLFVVALTLLVRRGRALVATITAFTVAHSLSLAATALGIVTLPSPPVEATIALSIVLVCAECLRAADSLTRRAPWLIAFSFGLLHGLGFASGLLAIGLPAAHVPAALLSFNVGVELGQLGTIAVVMGAVALAARLGFRQTWWRLGVIYAMGAVAASWSIERITAVFGL